MRSNKKRKMGLPPRWLNCPRFGDVVNELFVPFKTILDDDYSKLIPPSNRFDLQMFLNSSKAQNMGMVIDLTKTRRFYDSKMLGLPYHKIECEGHEGPPSSVQVDNFKQVVEQFVHNNSDKLIGVHCTHGFNRTGYMIVCCLVDLFDMELYTALELFNKARPPGIYKQDYIDSLIQLFDPELNIEAPERPAWCTNDFVNEDEADSDEQDESEYQSALGIESNDEDEDNTSCADDSSNLPPEFGSFRSNQLYHKRPNLANQNKAKTSQWRPPKQAKFMEGVSGVRPVLDCDDIELIHDKMRQLMQAPTRYGFLGSQPVSMTRENLPLIKTREYMVSWKADGTRYIMLILDKDQVYMLDRDNCIYQVDNLAFPCDIASNDTSHLVNTVVDGEMVIDQYQGKKFPRYLIYDLMVLDANYYGHEKFIRRLDAINKHIIRNRLKFISQSDKQRETFSVRIKDFFPLSKTQEIWEGKFRNQVCHEMDGLIFQPCGMEDFYEIGRCNTILKWKPPHLNSLDCILKWSYEDQPDMVPQYMGYLYLSGLKEPAGKIPKISLEHRNKYKDKIVEVTFDVVNRKWIILRERTDKSMPNHITTAKSVMQSMFNPVELWMIYKAIEQRNEQRSHQN